MKKIKYLLIGLVGTIVFCLLGGGSANAYSDYRRIYSYDRTAQIVYDSIDCIRKVYPYDTHTIAVDSNCNFDDYYYYLTNDYFVLDLKGNTLTNKNTSDGEYKTLFDVGSNAKLTITDSVGGGKLEGGILLSDSSSELIINDGIIGNSDLDGGAVTVNGGTITINGGTLIGEKYGLNVNADATLSIKKGKFVSAGVNNYGGILIIKQDSTQFNPNDLLIAGSKFSNSSFEEITVANKNYYKSEKSINVYEKHAINISEGIENGTVTSNTNLEYCDQTVTLTMFPNAGYQIKSVKIFNYDSSTDITDLVEYNATLKTFTMPDENVVVTVEFEKIPYTITVNSVDGATITSDKKTALPGEKVTLTVIPNEGYKLKKINILDMHDKMPVTLNEDNTFTMPDENVVVTVELEKIQYTITVNSIDGATITSDKKTALPGEKVTLTAIPNEGYKLKKINILDMHDKMPVTLNEDNIFTMPSYNVFITAECEFIYSEKTITKTEGSSTVSIKGTFSGNPELVITKTEKENEGYNSLIALVKEDKEVIGSYDVSVIGGDYEGELELTFTVGKQYEGDVVTIYHKKASGEIETFETTVKDGKAKITVNELSPFMLVADNEIIEKKDETPKTGTYDFTGIATLIIGLSVLEIARIKKRKEN